MFSGNLTLFLMFWVDMEYCCFKRNKYFLLLFRLLRCNKTPEKHVIGDRAHAC